MTHPVRKAFSEEFFDHSTNLCSPPLTLKIAALFEVLSAHPLF
jgi:hypothetical protein